MEQIVLKILNANLEFVHCKNAMVIFLLELNVKVITIAQVYVAIKKNACLNQIVNPIFNNK
jgi:hypothetical protein